MWEGDMSVTKKQSPRQVRYARDLFREMLIKLKRGREQEERAFGPHCRSNCQERRKG